MFNGVFFSCPHYTEQPPVMRRDGYGSQILKKMAELVKVCKDNKAELFCAGDLFHRKANTSIKEVKLMADVLSVLGKPMYMILGNHDIQGYNQNIDTQPVGVLVATERVKLLTEKGVVFGDVIVTGASYRANYEETEPYSVTAQGRDLHIHMTHGLLTETKMPFGSTTAGEVEFSADILVNGHWHTPWEDRERGIYNVGSLARVAMEANQMNRTPGAMMVRYNSRGKATCSRIELPFEQDVWVSEIRRETLDAEQVAEFVAEIKEMEIENDDSALDKLLAEEPVAVRKKVMEYLEDGK